MKITKVRSNHARADELERLPMEDEEDETSDEDDDETEADEGEDDDDDGPKRPGRRQRLGSRENFWGG